MAGRASVEVRQRGLSEVPFEFLNARLRGRRSRLYEGDRLLALADAEGLHELAFRLAPEADVREQADLERLLTASCARDLASYEVFLSGPNNRFYRALLDRFALENVKTLIRLQGRPDAAQAAARLLVPLPARFELPAEDLLACETLQELIRRVPLDGPRRSAQEALPRYDEAERRPYVEMALDKGYWQAMEEALDGLPGTDRAEVAPPVVAEAEAVRLVAALRAGSVYRIAWDRLAEVLPPEMGGVSTDVLQSLHAHPEPSVVLGELPWLRELLSAQEAERAEQGGPGFIGRVEEVLWQRVMRAAEGQYRRYLFGPAILVSYFYLRLNELRGLVRLVQLVRTGTDRGESQRRLGLGEPGVRQAR